MKKTFAATNWFKTDSPPTREDYSQKVVNKRPVKPKHNILAPFYCRSEQPVKLENQLNKFFVPGWKGESLISKNIKEFIKILDLFHKDVTSCLQNAERFSRRQKIAIYEEFMRFAEHKAINCSKLDNQQSFWKEFQNPDSEYSKDINLFVNIFSFRIATIYLFKLRFILTLVDKTKIEFNLKSLLYPNSFLTTVFRSASSSELKARSFEQNIFSWYRPNHELQNHLLAFREIYDKISISEYIKTISIKSEEILNQNTLYSHSLSNKQFGLFLNSLLINFPLWNGSLNNKSYCPYKIPNDIEIISCKYSGDYLESLGLSHWLAQDHNKNIKWDQILCPDYKNHDFANGLYIKSLNELQFLTFLAEIAPMQGQDPKAFLCNVINFHLYNRKDSNEVQKSLIFNETSLNNSTYDRVILNLLTFPENNPHHFLYQKIISHKKDLKEKGFLFVLTSKKLFIPSQKNKVSQLLQELKIEGVIDLTNISGKGEVGNYLYIFSNKEKDQSKDNKQTCLSFRFHANLKSFHEFENMTHMFYDFFKKNLGELPPMTQLYQGQFRLEFYQDAILNGQLIHSTTKDASNITHPSFFKKLMGICQPFDYFFNFQVINFEDRNFQANENYLNINMPDTNTNAEHVIIVDKRNKEKIKLEIIPVNQLEAKAYDYGHAFCSYFYAHKKWPELNIYAIMDFLNSSIGSQIINLTFSNEIRKVKGNLSKILVPSFYTNSTKLPEHIDSALTLFDHSPEDILNIHPRDIEKNFSELECLILKIAHDYPAQILNKLTKFKKTVTKSIENLNTGESKNIINFNNPLLKSPLLLSKTYPIYPDNEEIYIKFMSEANQNIHQNLESVKITSSTIGEEKSYGIELIANGETTVVLYSDINMIQFLNFILNQALGHPISTVLQSVSVPKIEDLTSIINSYTSLCRVLTDIKSKITPIQSRLLNSVIMNENKN